MITIGRWKGINDICDTRLKELSTKLPAAILNSKSDNTVKKYIYGFKAWCNWCNTFDSVKHIPASDIHISLYIISLIQKLCSVAKINEVVYSIGWAHEVSGFENPCDTFLVKSVVEGARRQLSRPCTKKEPITPEILRQLVDRFGKTTNLYDKRIVTMCLIGYAGFLRFSEIVGIRGCDIKFFYLYVSIFIEKSKTDKYREGSYVIIAKTNTPTCPVNMLLDYVNCAGISLHEE